MLTAAGFPSKRKPSSTLPCSPAPLCLGVHGSQPLPPHMGLVSAIVPKAGTIFKVQEARGWVPGTGAPRDQGPGREGPKLGAERGHWGWGAAGGSSGSGGGGPDPASSSSISSSNGTPSSSRKTWRTLRVVRVRGPRLQGGRETERRRLIEGSRGKASGSYGRKNTMGGEGQREMGAGLMEGRCACAGDPTGAGSSARSTRGSWPPRTL